MKVTSLPIQDAFLIDLDKREDDRGFFARFFCKEEFAQHNLATDFQQANNSLSAHKGTLRGMHYQLPPKAEVKMVRCIQGELYDVMIDLRKDSPSFGKSYGTVLSAENRRMLYIPKGCAHGFLTLTDNSEVLYMVSESYSSQLERGVRWDDPFFQIEWPNLPKHISERDGAHPNFNPDKDAL